MKRFFSFFLYFSIVLSVIPFFGVSALASSSSSRPISWDDVSEDVIALRDSYFDLWSSKGNFSQLFHSASEIPIKWLTFLADGTAALSPISGLFYYKTETAHKVDYTGSKLGLKSRFDNGDIKPDVLEISSDEFAESLEKDNDNYFPRKDYRKVSYRNDPIFQRLCKLYSSNRSYQPTAAYEGKFLYGSGDDLYFSLFFNEDDKCGYGLYQFHLTFEDVTNEEGTVVKRVPHLFYWDNVTQTEDEAVEASCSVTNVLKDFSDTCLCKYAYFSFERSVFKVYCYNTFDDFMKRNASSCYYNFSLPSDNKDSLSFDLSKKFTYLDYDNHSFNGTLENHAETCSLTNCDKGYICDGEPLILTSYWFDISRIPKGQIVTINGDTIYNYTITNPETGDSSKFGDFITNNYTYITNNNGGSSGGNVTVGGKIDVGGSVKVDVNVNVNGAGDNTSLPDVDIANNLPEAPQGFIDYLTSLFSFLPASVLVLILAGISAAIFCRVWGR